MSNQSPQTTITIDLKTYRMMILMMASIAGAFLAAFIFPYHDDREVVRGQQTAHGIAPLSRTGPVAQDPATQVMAESGTLRAAPGMDADITAQMSGDPRGKVMDMYRQDPTTPQVLLSAAMIYARNGNWAEAAEFLELAQQDHGDDVMVEEVARRIADAQQTGNTDLLGGNPEGSDEDLVAEAMADGGMLPQDHPSMQQPVDAADLSREEMKEQLLAAMEENPNDISAPLNAAAIYLEAEKYHEAKEFLQHAIAIDPVNNDALHMMSVCYAMTGEPKKGQHLLESILVRDADNGMAMFNLALINERFLRDFDTALDFYQRAGLPETDLDNETKQQAMDFAQRILDIKEGRQ